MALKVQGQVFREVSDRLRIRLALSLAVGIPIGAAVAALSPGPFWSGWLAAALLSVLAVYCLLSAWAWAGGGRVLAWMTALAFLLRLVSGIGFSLALPVFGYADQPTQQAGYLFKDASARDLQAWELAQSARPLWDTFREEFVTDQYGGLLALSAGVYRLLSPDSHRPFLLLILGAFFAALGVPFLYRAAGLRWGERVALLTGWIYALYPDGIFFASSQMREPFMVGLACIAFWAVIDWAWRRPSSWLVLGGSLLGMALISNRVTVAVAGFLGLLFLLEHVVGRTGRWQWLGWAGLAVGAVLVLAFSWEWFRSSTSWDTKVTDDESGRIAYAIDEASKLTGLPRDDLRTPIVVAYGLTRPVLPAAVVSNAKSQLMKGISIVRAAGWYALAPFLIFGLFSVWREPDPRKRRRAIWLALAVFAWLVIASARGGGDLVDNPRYRSLFLPWMALLAAWAIHWALVHKDAWLWRWITVEIIFLSFFTQWYVKRYYKIGAKLSFWPMVLTIVGLSALVLVGGWLWDRWRTSKARRLGEVR